MKKKDRRHSKGMTPVCACARRSFRFAQLTTSWRNIRAGVPIQLSIPVRGFIMVFPAMIPTTRVMFQNIQTITLYPMIWETVSDFEWFRALVCARSTGNPVLMLPRMNPPVSRDESSEIKRLDLGDERANCDANVLHVPSVRRWIFFIYYIT